MPLFQRTRERIGRVRALIGRAGQALLVLALIAFLLTAFVRDLWQFPRSAAWPSVQGEVTQSRFYMDDSFSVDFEYRYTVDGVTYTGSRITFFEYAVFANRVQNERFIDAHPVGTPVEVRYDPRDPTRSVLMRTIPLEQLWSPLLFALCLTTILLSAVAGVVMRWVMKGLRAWLPLS